MLSKVSSALDKSVSGCLNTLENGPKERTSRWIACFTVGQTETQETNTIPLKTTFAMVSSPRAWFLLVARVLPRFFSRGPHCGLLTVPRATGLLLGSSIWVASVYSEVGPRTIYCNCRLQPDRTINSPKYNLQVTVFIRTAVTNLLRCHVCDS